MSAVLNRCSLNTAIVVSVVIVSAVAAEPQDVQGVFGLNPVPESTAVAFWVPIEPGQIVAGVRWYNNDGSTTFPAVMGIAGNGDRPGILAEAVVLASDVAGESSSWVDLYFDTAVTSITSGLYLIFELPAGDGYLHEGLGGGPGFGYCTGSGEVTCWLTAEDQSWHAIGTEHRIAAEPIIGENKSAAPLVLGAGDIRPQVWQEAEGLSTFTANLVAAPNPCNPLSEIRFSLSSPAHVSLDLFDVRGWKVRTLIQGSVDSGEHRAQWNGTDDEGRMMPSGVYLVRLQAGATESSMRLTLVR